MKNRMNQARGSSSLKRMSRGAASKRGVIRGRGDGLKGGTSRHKV